MMTCICSKSVALPGGFLAHCVLFYHMLLGWLVVWFWRLLVFSSASGCCSIRYMNVHDQFMGQHIILFHNPMNKNLVRGKHNVLVHYADASTPDPEGVVRCKTFKWDFLWFILIKNLVICVPISVPTSHSKIKFTLQPQEQKSGRRVTQYSHTLYGC